MHTLFIQLLREAFREAEVNQFDYGVLSIVFQEKVLRLQVSMDNSLQVQVLDSSDHLANEIGGLSLTEFFGGSNAIK